MLGVFNSAVYFYPRYAAIRKEYQEKSRMASLCEILGLELVGIAIARGLELKLRRR